MMAKHEGSSVAASIDRETKDAQRFSVNDGLIDPLDQALQVHPVHL